MPTTTRERQGVLLPSPTARQASTKPRKPSHGAGTAAGGVRISLQNVSPKQAAEWLTRARPGLRTRDAVVATYARTMREGDWVFNGMPIVFGKSGQLLDGFHRLAACVQAKVPFQTLVVEDVPDDILHTLDQQRRRSFAGVLQSRGIHHASTAVTALMRLIRYDEGKMRRSGLSVPWARLDRLFAANEDDLVEAVQDSLNSPAKLLSESVRTPLIFMVRRARRPKAIERFLDAIANPKEYERDEPGRMIRRRLEEQEGAPDRAPPEVMMAWCIKALNDTIKGSRSEYYRWISKDLPGSGKRGEDYPKLWGYHGLTDPDVTQDGEPVAPGRRAAARRARNAGGAEGVSWGFRTIEPEQAKAWLEPAVNSGNRNIVGDHVAAIARDIAEGRWMLNVQPICFSPAGRLLNGQHRLAAVVQADSPIEVLVLEGVPDAAFATYDLQARRSPEFADLLPEGARGAAHFGDANLLNAAATLMWREEIAPTVRVPTLEGKAPKSPRPTAGEIRDLIAAHPGLLEQRGYARRVARLMRASLAMWIAYRIRRDDPRLGEIFLDRLETGAELPNGHLILKLRRKLEDYRLKNASPPLVSDAVLDAWHAFRKAPGLSEAKAR